MSARRLTRAAVAGMLAALAAVGVFLLVTQHGVAVKAKAADTANRVAAAYQDARFWVGQEESLERKYRLQPSPAVLARHASAQGNLTAALHHVNALQRSVSQERLISALLRAQADYGRATHEMFRAVDARNTRLVTRIDTGIVDPIFTAIETRVYGQALVETRKALHQSSSLKHDASRAFVAGLAAIMLAIGLVGSLAAVIRRYRRAERTRRKAELEHLTEIASTDSLTGLRNHRCFHEDLEQELQRTGRTGAPMALVMLDANDLKAVNDTYGHQAGDEQLRALARAISDTPRASDRAYRIGGDEFAVILNGAGEWEAFEFAQRLHARLKEGADGSMNATAGIAQALVCRPKEELVHEADLALVTAKRLGHDVVIYTPELAPFDSSAPDADEDRHIRTLAGALALAVDSKDPYTQSHSQTVSTLCALIATELGVDATRLKQIRLAGLLHDVGKIGIPDAILKKPAKLTAEEYEEMKTHSVLGEAIVRAAEMPGEARWVRHHHERIDGSGYPDGLADRDIPLESRIIHVADAFEAMTSDRAYRDAPGQEFAIQELRRHAGTQFDQEVVDALLRALASSAPQEPQVEVAVATG